MSSKDYAKKEVILVKFKNNKSNYYFNQKKHHLYIGDYVIVQAERGEDIGTVIDKRKQVDVVNGSKIEYEVVRKVEMKEIAHISELRKREEKIFTRIKEYIKSQGIEMKLVDVESQLDGNKIIFYFTAAHRIDFRELVKYLASTYRTRIEMRQIGVRDEAKKIGGYGICGRQLCCAGHLQCFKPISTEMAKEQHLSLNPLKISGLCGRLMCCLSYEHEFYKESLKDYPPLGARIQVTNIKGTVHEINIIKRTILLQSNSGEYHLIEIDKLPEIEYQKVLKIAHQYQSKGIRASITDSAIVEEGEVIKGDNEIEDDIR